MVNPYITGFPADPESFAGREKEKKIFQKALAQTCGSRPVSPQNIAIIGSWGIGKTSLLNRCILDAKKENCLVVKITLSPEKCKSMEDFAVNTIDAFYQAIWKNQTFSAKLKSKFSQWKIDGLQLLGIKVTRKKLKATTASTILTQKILELWDLLESELPGIVIAYDDLQYLSQFCPNGLYDLRAVFQDTREAQVRSMLIATGDLNLFSKIRGLSEPLLRFFEQICLEPFSTKEAEEALKLPLKVKSIKLGFNKKVREAIFEKTKRHPYFISFFAHDLFEHKSKGRITIKLFERVYRGILEHLGASRFMNDLAITSEQEREVLFAFCQKKILKAGDLKKISNPSMRFKRLEAKGLIEKVTRGSFQLYHTLFREYLKIM